MEGTQATGCVCDGKRLRVHEMPGSVLFPFKTICGVLFLFLFLEMPSRFASWGLGRANILGWGVQKTQIVNV